MTGQLSTGTHRWRPTIRYLSQTEVHVYALSIGASVLLSFFPFLIVMLTIMRDVLHFPMGERALVLALSDYFPGDLGAFIIRNLTKVNHGRYQLFSLVLLLFTANGIFEPLEVALNRAWGVKENRSYLKNQLLSLFMLLLCGGLALGSVVLTAVNTKFVAAEYGLQVIPPGSRSPSSGRRHSGDDTLPVPYLLAAAESAGYRRGASCRWRPGRGRAGSPEIRFLRMWPWLDRKFQNEYGPFNYSVSIVVFSLLTALLVLAGAEWSARDPALCQLDDAP